MRHADASLQQAVLVLGSSAQDGMASLLRAWTLAVDARQSPAAFGLELASLRHLGLTESDLRWLICRGYVEHLLDLTLAGEPGRTMRASGALHFAPRSCFCLTQAGVEFAEQLCRPLRAPRTAAHAQATDGVPTWHAVERRLCFAGQTLKEFATPAPNQELILTAFEEESWAAHIDDPLPPRTGVDPRMRLNKTLYRLNHSLAPPLIHFSCEHGHTVRWQTNHPPG